MENVKVEPFKLIGIWVNTTNENNQAATEIATLWQRFIEENILTRISDKVDDTIYSLYTEYEGDHTQPYTAILGCKVKSLDNIPEGMIGKSFEGGNYVKITAKGDLMQGLIVKEWTKIWEIPLQRSFTADFEVFSEKAQNPTDTEVDFLIAVQ